MEPIQDRVCPLSLGQWIRMPKVQWQGGQSHHNNLSLHAPRMFMFSGGNIPPTITARGHPDQVDTTMVVTTSGAQE